jgi:hypothetical protein
MSSVTRGLAERKEGLTRFVKPDGPYYDAGRDNFLFPFTCVNQTLDITYSGNDFKALMVDNLNESPGQGDETDTMVSIMGGPRLVTALGENFKEYIRAWRSGTIDSGSPIEVYIPAQVLRVQEASTGSLSAFSDDVYLISAAPPSGDNYVTGGVENNYRTTFIFKTPLTFTIVEGGVTKYITFRSGFEQE